MWLGPLLLICSSLCTSFCHGSSRERLFYLFVHSVPLQERIELPQVEALGSIPLILLCDIAGDAWHAQLSLF